MNCAPGTKSVIDEYLARDIDMLFRLQFRSRFQLGCNPVAVSEIETRGRLGWPRLRNFSTCPGHIREQCYEMGVLDEGEGEGAVLG